MSLTDENLEAITAALGLSGTGANKGFWEFQLRDRHGRWAEMGRGLLAMVRSLLGDTKALRGTYIGASQIPGYARILVEGQEDLGIPSGVYHVPSGKTEVFDALIPEADLKRLGIKSGPKLDSRGKPVKSTKWGISDVLELKDLRVDPITDKDRKLAKAVPTDAEKKTIEANRAKSPLAKLEPGAEDKMAPEALKKLLAEAGVELPKEETPSESTPDVVDVPSAPSAPSDPMKESRERSERLLAEYEKNGPEAPELYGDSDVIPATRAWLEGDSREFGAPVYWTRRGSDKVEKGYLADGYIYAGNYSEDDPNTPVGIGSIDDFMDSIGNANDRNGISGIYRGLPPLVKEEQGGIRAADKSDISKIATRRNWEKKKAASDKAAAKLVKDAMDGRPVGDIDDAIKAARDGDDGGDDEFIDEPETSKLDNYTQGIVDNMAATAQGQEPKEINKTLRKLHGLLSKPDSNKAGTEAAIKALNDIVKSKGGTPFVPGEAKPKKSGYFKRGEKNDSVGGDVVAVFDGEDSSAAEVGEIVGGKDEFGKYTVKMEDGVWKYDAADMQPINSATEDMPELADNMGAPKDGGDEFDDLDFGDEPEVVVPKKTRKRPSGDPVDAPDSNKDDVPDINTDAEPVEKPTAEELDKAIEIVSKMSMEELDALAKPEDYLEDTNGILPSEEQTRALNAITRADVDVVIDALAGAGKTWTLTAACNSLARLRPDARILVLAFGNKNAADARRKIPKGNADAMTTHALAIKSLTRNQRDAMDAKKGYQNASSEADIALVLGLDDTPLPSGNLSADDTAHMLGKAISYFCNSADKEIGEKHVMRALMDLDGFDPEGFQVPQKLIDFAKAYWADLSSDRKPVYNKDTKKVDKKRIRLSHDHYLKMWSLSDPDLRDVIINGLPATHVFFDEAQDTNPTVSEVMRRNRGRVQQTFVGDPNQSIFGFRGAENFLDEVKPGAGAVVDLTRTRRFGDGMTDPGNGFLNLIGARRRVRGVGTGGEVVSGEEIPNGPSTAVLTRTNYGALDEIIRRRENGETVGCLSVFYDDLEKSIYHLKWLLGDYKTRGRSPQTADGRPAFSDDFVGINNFAGLMKRAERDPKSKAARWLELLRSKGNGETELFEQILDDLVVDKSDIGTTDQDLDVSPGTTSTLWVTKGGKDIVYSVDDTDTVRFSGTAMFDTVDGKKFYEILKERGARFNKFTKEWALIGYNEDDRKALLDSIAALIPNRVAKDERVPTAIVSTAHRAKGLEWDNVQIGPDFPEPKVNPVNGEMEFPNEEELKLAYVALTRARKMISRGSLAWGEAFEGREGLSKANLALDREPDYGMDSWDYHESQGSEEPKTQDGLPLDSDGSASASLGRMTSRGDEYFDDDELEALDTAKAPKGPKGFLSKWKRQSAKKNSHTRIEGGVTWELTENRDGTVTLRSRNDSSIPTKKYDNLDAAEADFKNNVETGKKSSREELKKVVGAFDKDGSIAKLIESGASAQDISDKITSSDDWEDALENNSINIQALGRALGRVGANPPARTRNPRRAKPPVVQPPKYVAPPANNKFYTDAVAAGRGDTRLNKFRRINMTEKQLEKFFKDHPSSKVEDIRRHLLLLNPDATVKPDGSIVWFRGRKIEQAGPSQGQEREVEISIKDNKNNTFTVIVDVLDPKTEKTQRFYHYATHHSLASLVGTPKKQKPGVERLLYEYFDRDLSKNPHPDAQDQRLYGGVDGAIKKLRAGRFDRIMSDKKKDDSSFKLRTPGEHARFILNGRNRKFNDSLQNWWTTKRKERASLFEAIDSGDMDSAFNIYNNYLTSLPDTPEARKIGSDYIKAAIKEKFPRLDTREMLDIFRAVEDHASGSLSPVGTAVVPHLDRNNVPVVAGSTVRWFDNNGQSVIGRVRFPISADNPNEGAHIYSDFAIVDFKDPAAKGKDEVFGLRLNTKNMEVVPDDTPITEYKGWVRNDDAKLARYEEAGYGFDPKTGEFYDKITGQVIDKLGNSDDEGDEDEDEELDGSTPNVQRAASKLQAGDFVFDEDGNELGTVVSARRAVSKKTGKEMIGVEFEDGTKKVYSPNDSIDIFDPTAGKNKKKKTITPSSPKDRTVQPKKVRGPVAEEAAVLGLGANAKGKGHKVLPKNTTNPDDPEVSEKMAGTTIVSTKPTDEARAAKDKTVELGGKILDTADERTNEKMREMGYDIQPGTSFVDLIHESDRNITETQGDLTLKNNAISKLERDGTSLLKRSPKRVEALLARMKDEGLLDSKGDIDKKKLAAALIEGDLRPLAYQVEATPDLKHFGAFAYAILKGDDEAKTKDARDLTDAQDVSRRANNDAINRGRALNDAAAIASGDALRDTLSDEGVEFNNVSFLEFDQRIVSDVAGLPFRPEDDFLSARALQEAFTYLPSSWIRQFASHLKSTGKVLRVKAGVKRGHFKPIAGGYELDLSSISNARSDQTKVTDTALHELTHGLQKIIPNLRTLEHAWLFDRSRNTDGDGLVGVTTIPGYNKSERAMAVPGLAAPYQAKVYARSNKRVALNPDDAASEVTTMGMQDLFTAPGITSIGRGMVVIARNPKDRRKKKTFKNAYYDETTGTWFEDSSMTNSIEEVVHVFGRKQEDGQDRESRSFITGTLLVLNDWSPTDGTGPGGGVVKK